ncbi:MAG: MFS transporter, partial [Candidatus Dormibacteraeota bacterium]|nr:MFS transporter [Candidatus Dormibacteraeota bacterium]
QALLQVSWSGSQPLVALKLLELQPSNTTTATGIAFAASGIASAVAGISYSRLVMSSGYRAVSAVAALLTAAALVLLGGAPTVLVVIIATFLIGLFIGSIGPATSTMLGLEAPPAAQGRIFGLSSSATAVGFGVGPLLGGTLAGFVTVSAALYVLAAIAVLLASVMAIGAREPRR